MSPSDKICMYTYKYMHKVTPWDHRFLAIKIKWLWGIWSWLDGVSVHYKLGKGPSNDLVCDKMSFPYCEIVTFIQPHGDPVAVIIQNLYVYCWYINVCVHKDWGEISLLTWINILYVRNETEVECLLIGRVIIWIFLG